MRRNSISGHLVIDTITAAARATHVILRLRGGMLSHRIRRIVSFVFFVIVSCIGCDRIDRFYEDEVDFFGPIFIEVLCISEDRPAEVLIHVSGLGGTGCGYTPFKNVYADRVRNTISLKPTVIDTGDGYGVTTCDGIIEYHGDVTVKDLEVGEYEIGFNDSERVRLRIEEEKASVFLRPSITITTVEMKTSKGIKRFDIVPPLIAPWPPDPWIKTRETVQVTLGVKGYCRGSEVIDPLKRISIEIEAEEITVDISSEVKIADCLPDQDTSYTKGLGYDAEIDLGLFEPGDYRVNVNGNEVRFSIRPDLPPKQDR